MSFNRLRVWEPAHTSARHGPGGPGFAAAGQGRALATAIAGALAIFSGLLSAWAYAQRWAMTWLDKLKTAIGHKPKPEHPLRELLLQAGIALQVSAAHQNKAAATLIAVAMMPDTPAARMQAIQAMDAVVTHSGSEKLKALALELQQTKWGDMNVE